LTCNTAGKYLVIGNIQWAAHATGIRAMRIWKGATVVAEETRMNISDADSYAGGTISTIVDLAVNDYVLLVVYQDSGGNLNVNAAAQYTPEFMMVRIGD